MIPLPKRLALWGLKMTLSLHRWSYLKAGAFAVRYYGGVHPKHWLTGIHTFILENIGPTDVVLDIGCGRGELTGDVADKAKEVVAFDLDPVKIEQARRLRSRPNLTYYVGEATRDLPPGRTFDVAIVSGLLEHLSNRDEFLQATSRLASRMILRLPDLHRSWTVLVSRELGIPYTCCPDHRIEYTVESARRELERNGWQVESLVTAEGEIRIVARSLQVATPDEKGRG